MIRARAPFSNVATFPDLSNELCEYNVMITDRNDGQNC